VLGLLLIFVATSAQYTVKSFGGETVWRSAFLRWRPQILELLDGEDVYLKHNYPNAPIMPLLLSPLALLPEAVGSLCWFYLKVGMALLSISWTFRLVESPDRPFPPWAKILATLLSLRPLLGDLSHGNVNLFILFLVVGALYAFRHRCDLISGLALALAIACKVTPVLLVPYFLWKRAWKVLAACALGLVLFVGLVPGLFLGMEHNLLLFASWFERMVKPFVLDGVVTTEHLNQSLPGLVYRLLTHSPSSIGYDQNDQPIPLEFHNLLSLSPDMARWLVKGFMALFALTVVWCCRTPTRPRHGWRLAAEYSLIVLGMLIFSERTWKHHCVTFLLPFSVIAYYLAVCRPGVSRRYYLIGSLAAVVGLMTLTARPGKGTTSWLGDSRLAHVYGAYVWAYVVLVAALVVLLRSEEKPVTSGQKLKCLTPACRRRPSRWPRAARDARPGQ
jgi:hypothetical protein